MPDAAVVSRVPRTRARGTLVLVATLLLAVGAAAGTPPAPAAGRTDPTGSGAAGGVGTGVGVTSDTAHAQIPLYQQAVSVLPDGARAEVPAAALAVYLPGTRVPDPAAAVLAEAVGATPTTTAALGPRAAAAAAAEQRAWLAAGDVPGAGGPHEELARSALLDLHSLTVADGVVVAGWSAKWRYVWPRDSAFVAVALARTGHVDDALAVLDFLARVQEPDGSFEARYLPDGSGPPDDRGLQTDGTGWSMWAAGLVLAEVDDARRVEVAQRLAPLVERSADRALRLVAAGLPPASPDYWEVPESEVTLGTAAPLVAGLEQAAVVLDAAGRPERAATVAAGAADARQAVVDAFGPTGYGRYATRTVPDAASAFVLAPFWSQAPHGGVAAWLASVPSMLRPAAGLAPGGGWRRDGVSWTPQTTLYAWVAAEQGDAGTAMRWLDVVGAHRTPSGAIPEKLLADGAPAAVAPLGWSAACVLLAIDALDATS
ncbi:glycoside hydrolase family 15 [Cellulomonas sp. S1-8]|uniref:glycoside hydrolase family 15 n=1 Tax=Cellulomonas sp. S1-8 TaxID=2904790 RepID=UPI0022439D85|nr:glycoside hydrolase family 15 [Cellulomonas sp. S1-8]UZN04071.1 glycoside hydrolase family 15 [Cellulomonas sp. S1-8]